MQSDQKLVVFEHEPTGLRIGIREFREEIKYSTMDGLHGKVNSRVELKTEHGQFAEPASLDDYHELLEVVVHTEKGSVRMIRVERP